MSPLDRRGFLQQALVAASAGWTLAPGPAQSLDAASGNPDLHLATFRWDVTPPNGHPCCGGWIKPIEAVDDRLEALGVILLGVGKPIVLCVVDWTGILNEAHVAWRAALAEAAGTTPDRVAVHSVHQHNAPMACLETDRLVAAQGDLSHVMMVDFFEKCLDGGRQAVSQAIGRARRVTHVAHGQGRVRKVASNRRMYRDKEGNVLAMRGSSCRDPKLIAMPEGLIDPWLKTVAFHDGKQKLAALHYYATHPMSYYGDGRASSDFAGLARKQRQQEEPDCLHMYFTGCSGNIAAGKYNDGSHAMRPILTKRIHDGIVLSEARMQRSPIGNMQWKTVHAVPPIDPRFSADSLRQEIADRKLLPAIRGRAAYTLALLRRIEKKIPIVISTLRINDISLLQLPGECFVQYQLRAQHIQPTGFVATAAYGDGGPWYVPIRQEFPFGGYEVSVAFCGPKMDDVLTRAMRELLG